MFKKAMSVFLSVLMVLSGCSAAMVAFAAEQEEPTLAALEEALEATTGAAPEAADETVTEAETEASTDADIQKTVDALLATYEKLAKEERRTAAQDALLAKLEARLAALKAQLAANAETAALAEEVGSVVYAAANTVAGVANAVVNAAASASNVDAFTEKVTAFSGKLNTSSPSEADLAAYKEICDLYAKLSTAEQDKIDILTFDKFYHMIIDREYYVYRDEYKAEHGKTPSSAEAYGVAQERALKRLGEISYVKSFPAAAELYTVLNDSKKSAQEKLDAYKAADTNAQIYASLYSKSYGYFSSKLDSGSIEGGAGQIAKAFGKELDAADPFTEVKPQSVKKPSEKDYEGGKESPEYIAAWNSYMANQKLLSEYNCRKANHTNRHNLEGFQKVAAAVPRLQAVSEMMSASLDAYLAFQENNNYKPSQKVVKQFEKLSAYDQKVVNNFNGFTLWTAPKEYSTYWATTNMTAGGVYDACAQNAQYDRLGAFSAVLAEITEPYSRADIDKARAAYDAVPLLLRPFIPKADKEKYAAIMAAIAPDDPTGELPDLSAFVKTTVAYPKGVTREQVAKAIPNLEQALAKVLTMIPGMENGLSGMLKTGVYTNATVVTIASTLNDLLAGTGILSIKPSALAKQLKNDGEKCKGAIEKLNGCGDDWANVKAENGDFGFQDGDKEGFLDATASIFRTLSLLTMALTLENTIDTEKGTYTYGAYEDLVPIFEALEVPEYMTSHEYTLYVKQVESEASYKKMDARFRPILAAVFSLIESVADKPLEGLVDLLPKLGWALKQDLLTKQISLLISKLKIISITPPDLSAGALYDMIAPMLKGIQVGEKQKLDESGNPVYENGNPVMEPITIDIHLSRDNFLKFVDEIGGCGTGYAAVSKARGTGYRLAIEPDQPDSFVVLFRWLYGELTNDQNIAAIKTVIDTQNLGAIPTLLIKTVLNRVTNMSADQALKTVVNLAAPKVPDIGDLFPGLGGNEGNDRPGLGDIIGGIFGNKGEGNGETPQTENPDVPKTGGASMAAFSLLSLAAAAGVAGYALRLKKRED